MKHTFCNEVRVEIDEKDLNASLSAGAMQHLRHCNECQEFQSKETKLRQIVGNLETVTAPADFDFRLRARLASERTGSNYLSTSTVRVWRMRSAAVAAMLVLFAATIYMIRQNQTVEPVRDANRASNIAPPSTPPESPQNDSQVAAVRGEPASPSSGEVTGGRPRHQPAPQSKRQAVAVDFGSKPAPVVSADQTFSLEVAQPSFKVSLDDANGSARTISVPAVSFGSRRVLNTSTTSAQYAPKGDW
jgi:hypothetical protein